MRLFVIMILHSALVFCGVLGVAWCGDHQFPAGFKFGAATAAYQIEGAWNVSGKGESIWDRFTHTHPEIVVDGSNGDVACDSYHLWREDVQLARNLGLHFYRFSVSWPRILPTGLPDRISEDGVRYYSNLIDELLKYGIEPIVTLYHFDLPQRLQNLGGWANRDIMDWFGDYSRVVFDNYADRVKTWITINEGITFCDTSLSLESSAPGFVDTEFAAYMCNKNVLLAHAKAWRLYDEEYKPKYKGKVSLANHLVWYEPLAPGDEEYAELAHQHCTGRYSHAIYSDAGGWPPAVESLLAKKSLEQGLQRSQLSAFTEEEKKFVKGTYDFYGLNFYTSRAARKLLPEDDVTPEMWPMTSSPAIGVFLYPRPEWEKAHSFWFYVNPEGIRKMLSWLKNEYGDLEFLITENGYSTPDDTLNDYDRVNFHKENIKQVQLAIREDQVNVVGYSAWSLIDNFEWGDGYSNKFGLHAVDFSSPARARTPRLSARYYSRVIAHNTWDVSTDWNTTTS